MYKLALLLIPLIFFMTSCTIDRNDKTGNGVLQNNTGNIMNTFCNDASLTHWNYPGANTFNDGTPIDIKMSIVVKSGNSLFYFRNSDNYRLFGQGDLSKSPHPKGYIYTFNEYSCTSHSEKELVDSGAMNQILGALPKNFLSNVDRESSYYPNFDYIEDYEKSPYSFGPGFSFFDGILTFDYNSGTGSDSSELSCKVVVSIITHHAMISCSSDGIKSGDNYYYKNITY